MGRQGGLNRRLNILFIAAVPSWRMNPSRAQPLDRYAESIDPAVHCNTCEAVCCRLTVVLMPDDHVPTWLIDRDEHGMETLAKGEDGWCAAVDPNTSGCTIYDERPSICRKFAMGSPSCRDERHKWFGATIPTAVHLL